jgi:hypothetical protein
MTGIVVQMQDVRAANVVSLGAISKFFNVNEDIWLEASLSLPSPRVHELELNRKDFLPQKNRIGEQHVGQSSGLAPQDYALKLNYSSVRLILFPAAS